MNTLQMLSGLRMRLHALAPVPVMALAACHKKEPTTDPKEEE